MAKRKNRRSPALNDWHLWTEVTRSVSPIAKRQKPVDPDAPASDSAFLKPTSPKFVSRGDGGKLFRNAHAAPLTQGASVWSPGSTPIHHAFADPAHHRTLEPRVHRRVRRGQLPIDAKLDLHGLRQEEARAALYRFVMYRADQNDRTILVITGKGLKKTGPGTIEQRGVLRHMLPQWLNEPALAPYIAGWEVSARQHGGEGAYYVRLKRRPA